MVAVLPLHAFYLSAWISWKPYLVVVGSLAIFQLPVSEYPDVVPPQIVVRAQFPGANPRVIAETVATPLEEQINGVENMLYMSSNSTADGRFSIAVTFDLGTNLDIAQVQVQNRVATALPRVPLSRMVADGSPQAAAVLW